MMKKLSNSRRPIRLRWILLIVYLVVGGVIVGNCFLHLGHSRYCDCAFYLLLPAGYASAVLLKFLIPWGAIGQGSMRNAIEIITLPIPFIASCAQYYLVGLLLDKLLARRQKH